MMVAISILLKHLDSLLLHLHTPITIIKWLVSYSLLRIVINFCKTYKSQWQSFCKTSRILYLVNARVCYRWWIHSHLRIILNSSVALDRVTGYKGFRIKDFVLRICGCSPLKLQRDERTLFVCPSFRGDSVAKSHASTSKATKKKLQTGPQGPL